MLLQWFCDRLFGPAINIVRCSISLLSYFHFNKQSILRSKSGAGSGQKRGLDVNILSRFEKAEGTNADGKEKGEEDEEVCVVCCQLLCYLVFCVVVFANVERRGYLHTLSPLAFLLLAIPVHRIVLVDQLVTSNYLLSLLLIIG